ncbi:hypothetical protein GCM10010442_10000 [Kitasatospora kifunensis]
MQADLRDERDHPEPGLRAHKVLIGVLTHGVLIGVLTHGVPIGALTHGVPIGVLGGRTDEIGQDAFLCS